MTSYKPIEPTAEWNRDAIVSQGDDLGDLEKYLSVLEKDEENPTIWEKAGKLLEGDPTYFTRTVSDEKTGGLIRSPRSPRSDLERNLTETENNISLFAKKHKSTILGKLSDEDYSSLAFNLPLYKTGNKEQDELIDALKEVNRLRSIKDNHQEIYKYILERLEKEKVSQSKKTSFSQHGAAEAHIMFEKYLKIAHGKLNEIIADKEGKVRVDLLKRTFLNSLSEAEDALDRVTYSDGEKSDVWEANVRPYYLALFNKVYEIEKKADKETTTPEKQERDKQRKERRAKGMPF